MRQERKINVNPSTGTPGDEQFVVNRFIGVESSVETTRICLDSYNRRVITIRKEEQHD